MRCFKGICLAILLLSVTIAAKAQGGPPPPGSSFKPTPDFMAKMSEILPNAPNTAAIEKFGGVDIEMNTGVVKKSIELKPFTSRKISVPIRMGFNSMGVKVNEYPSRVGLGWHILAGGVISRVIYGRDDLIADRYVPNFSMNPNEDDPQTTTYTWRLNYEGNRDASPDIFSYNFGQYSGKFILDSLKNILPIEITSIKFYYNSLPAIPWTFRAVTPDGTEYLFGGTGAIESTKIGMTRFFNDFVPNAWHLTKITDIYGAYINFSYQEFIYGPVITDIEQTQVANDPTCGDPVCPSPENPNPPNGCILDLDEIRRMTAKVAQLMEINNGEGDRVTFTYSEQGYPEKIITEIKYYSNTSTLQSKYELEYDIVNTTLVIPSLDASTIPFLRKIKEKGADGAAISFGHLFNYYSKNLVPQRFIYSQDHWGYYNNQYNNTLIPPPDDPQQAVKFPAATANRNPVPYYAVMGMLSSVTYPTGGKDSIIYEPNTATETKDVNGYATISQAMEGIYETSYVYSNEEYFSTGYDPLVRIDISCFYTVPNSPAPHPGGRVIIRNTNTNQEVVNIFIAPPIPPATGSNTSIQFVTLPAGNYAVKTGSQGTYVKTTSLIKRRDGLVPNYQTLQTAIGGMRVKKVITSDNSGGPDMIKRYYYGTIANKEQSSAQYYTQPKYWAPLPFTDGVVDAMCVGLICSKSFLHYVMHSTSLNRLNSQDSKITEYTSVLESHGGDDFESGATEHKFNVLADAAPQNIRGTLANVLSPYSNNSIWSLGETETNIYKKTTGGLVKIKSAQYENYMDPRIFSDQPFYFVTEKTNLHCWAESGGQIVGPAPIVHANFSINKYYISRVWKYLKTQRDIVYDENGANPVTTQVDFTYDDLLHLNLTKRTFINSKGETFTEHFTYPVNYPGQYPYPDMITRNIVTPVIEQTNKLTNAVVTNKELSRVKTNYKGWQSNAFFELDSIQKSFNGVALETELKFNEYDEKGNIKQTTAKNGIITSYFWGYNKKYPVAKVVGKTYSEALASGISETLINSTTISDADMRTELNKLRTLTNCFATTYTYKHPVGMTSETDPNGYIKYYEYDQFSRLVLVRDNNSNILKKICYNYNGQPENCTSACTNTTPNWQNTSTPPYCVQGTCGNTGYQEQEQRDMNPCSPTYNQLSYVPSYNPTNCPPSTNIIITYENYVSFGQGDGFTALYTQSGTGQIFTFNIPASGTGVLGCLPAGGYSLTISKPGNSTVLLFGTGCSVLSGTSAYFKTVIVGGFGNCNMVTIGNDVQ